MDILLAGLFYLGLITLIGHGMWVAMAALGRLLLGSKDEPISLLPSCPGCGYQLRPNFDYCPACGLRQSVQTEPAMMVELSATARQLERFWQSGLIDFATYQQLQRIVEAERRQQTAPRQAPEAAPPIEKTPSMVTTPAGSRKMVEPEIAARRSRSKKTKGDFQRRRGNLTEPAESIETEVLNPVEAVIQAEPVVTTEPASKVEPVINARPVSEPEAASDLPARPRPFSSDRPQQLSTPPPPPRPPRKPFTEVLASFMEEKNIRWGELVGGLLIVGCSIALVVSLWAQIQQIPVLKFFIFTSITGALFGLGLYTEHRWKLPTTSRGLLIIATLLVPLNFLAIAAFSYDSAPGSLLAFGSEVVALALFLAMVYSAGRVIAPTWPWLLAIGVLGPSFTQLVIRRSAGPGVAWPALYALGALPLIGYWGTNGWMLRRLRGWQEVGEREANQIFMLLGLTTFSTLLPFGLLLFKTGQVALALRQLAPLVSLAGVPALMSGLELWRRVKDEKLGEVRTAGTSIAIIGMLTLLAGLVLAWPRPASIFGVAVVNFIILTAVAVRFKLPVAHLLAIPCLILAYLIGLHVAFGNLDWRVEDSARLVRLLVSSTSSTALAPMFVLLGSVVEVLSRRGRRPEARYYARVAGAVGLVSLVLVTGYGFGRAGDPNGAVWIYALYAASAFWIAWRTDVIAASWLGSGLLLAGIVQAVVFKFAGRPALEHPWQIALLTYASLAVAATAIGGRGSSKVQRLLAGPMNRAALAISLAAAVLLPFNAGEATVYLSARMFWLAAVWLALSCLNSWPALFTAFQVALTFGVALAVMAWLENRPWYGLSPHPLLDPRTLQAEGIALALLSLAWIGLRLGLREFGVKPPTRLEGSEAKGSELGSSHKTSNSVVAARLLYQSWPSFDHLITALVLMWLVALGCYGAWPGVVKELMPKDGAAVLPWQTPIAQHEYALGAGSWFLLIIVLLVLIAGLWEKFRRRAVLGVMLALAVASLLLAGRWEWDLATASALRWLAAGFLILASFPIWFREQVARLVAPLGWPEAERRAAGLERWSRALLLMLTVAPVLALTLLAAGISITRGPLAGPVEHSFFHGIGQAISYVGPLALVSLVLVGYGVRERSSAYAFAAGLVLNLTVTLAYLLSVITGGGILGSVEVVRLVQLNITAGASFAFAWLGARSWHSRHAAGGELQPAGALLKIQILIGLTANLLLIAPADLWLFFRPERPIATIIEIGSGLGWVALALSGAAAIWSGVRSLDQLRPSTVCSGLLAAGSLLAFGVNRWNTSDWLSYHTLLITTATTAWLMLIAGWRARDAQLEERVASPGIITRRLAKALVNFGSQPEVIGWATVLGLVTLVMALRAVAQDPGKPWWSVGAIVAMCLLAAGLAHLTASRIYLYAAGMLFNLAATTWWVTEHLQPAGEPDKFVALMHLVHLNLIASAGFGLAWLGVRAWRTRRRAGANSQTDAALAVAIKTQIGVTLAVVLLIIASADVLLFLQPGTPSLWLIGGVWGWLALVLSCVAAVWLKVWRLDQPRPSTACLGLLAAGSMAAFEVSRWDTGNWLSYHTLLVTSAAAAWLLLIAGWLTLTARREVDAAERAPGTSGRRVAAALTKFGNQSELAELAWWTTAAGYLTLALALRAMAADPGRPWWSVGAIMAMSLLAAGLACLTLNRSYLYAAGVLLNLAATTWWVTEFWRVGFESIVELIEVNVIALALPGVAWLMLELRVFRRAGTEETIGIPLPFHHVAAWGSLAAMASVVVTELTAVVAAQPLHSNARLAWLALAAVTVMMTACLWDATAKYTVTGLYVMGLAAIGLTLDSLGLNAHWLSWAAVIVIAGYSVVTSGVWQFREHLMALGDRLRIPRRAESSEPGLMWLVSANLLQAPVVVLLSYWVALTFEGRGLRLLAASAAIVQALAIGLLAHSEPRSPRRKFPLALGILGLVAWGWAWLEPGASGNLLNRSVVLLIVMTLMIELYRGGSTRLLPQGTAWRSAARGCVPWLFGFGLAALLFILGLEVAKYTGVGEVRLNALSIIVVSAVLLDLILTSLAFAVWPGRDPFGLSEQDRMRYVYAAEALLALLFIHLRLSMPRRLGGPFHSYWPLTVMVIAFLGVGLSELFRRQGRLVLAEPLERTGVLLPLLPVLGFWITDSKVNYSGLLLLTGALYSLLSITRRSFGFGLLAALAGNGGLWYFLKHVDGYGLLDHPQLWLIPISLSVLAAAYLNREQLSPGQMTTIRYFTLIMVYVSSTADIFINGVAASPWLPIVLAFLSVAGVIAGVMMRVRAFLFLGTIFLGISLLTMIWHASANLGWAWLWYVTGIALGLLIILLFALFEKKRDEMLRLIDGLRTWE